uniref:Uncharacterized protein n=1 Tax=Arundo donax TaxID=35708 RepID=A0A0A8ZVH3_ARUDO
MDGSIGVSLSLVSSERSFLADFCTPPSTVFSPERLLGSIA